MDIVHLFRLSVYIFIILYHITRLFSTSNRTIFTDFHTIILISVILAADEYLDKRYFFLDIFFFGVYN